MSVARSLNVIVRNQEVLNDKLHTIIRMLIIMGKGMDALVAAVDNNANATDTLSDEVAEAVAWIKDHNFDNDPELEALAARLEEKNAKALKARDDLDAATREVEASGGQATP